MYRSLNVLYFSILNDEKGAQAAAAAEAQAQENGGKKSEDDSYIKQFLEWLKGNGCNSEVQYHKEYMNYSKKMIGAATPKSKLSKLYLSY